MQMEGKKQDAAAQDYEQARSVLLAIAREYPQQGEVDFELGNLALLYGDTKEAVRCYQNAEEKELSTEALFQNHALAREYKGELRRADCYYKKALACAENEQERWAAMTAAASFYLRNDMVRKAEQTADQYIEQYPEAYQGWHLKFLCCMTKEETASAAVCLNKAAEKFADNPQYLLDRLSLLLQRRELNGLEETLEALFNGYGNTAAGFSEMMLAMMHGDYLKAAGLGDAILAQQKEKKDFWLYLTLYYQIVNLYLIFDKKMPQEICDGMRPAAEVVKKWFREQGMEPGLYQETFEVIFGK